MWMVTFEEKEQVAQVVVVRPIEGLQRMDFFTLATRASLGEKPPMFVWVDSIVENNTTLKGQTNINHNIVIDLESYLEVYVSMDTFGRQNVIDLVHQPPSINLLVQEEMEIFLWHGPQFIFHKPQCDPMSILSMCSFSCTLNKILQN